MKNFKFTKRKRVLEIIVLLQPTLVILAFQHSEWLMKHFNLFALSIDRAFGIEYQTFFANELTQLLMAIIPTSILGTRAILTFKGKVIDKAIVERNPISGRFENDSRALKRFYETIARETRKWIDMHKTSDPKGEISLEEIRGFIMTYLRRPEPIKIMELANLNPEQVWKAIKEKVQWKADKVARDD